MPLLPPGGRSRAASLDGGGTARGFSGGSPASSPAPHTPHPSLLLLLFVAHFWYSAACLRPRRPLAVAVCSRPAYRFTIGGWKGGRGATPITPGAPTGQEVADHQGGTLLQTRACRHLTAPRARRNPASVATPPSPASPTRRKGLDHTTESGTVRGRGWKACLSIAVSPFVFSRHTRASRACTARRDRALLTVAC